MLAQWLHKPFWLLWLLLRVAMGRKDSSLDNYRKEIGKHDKKKGDRINKGKKRLWEADGAVEFVVPQWILGLISVCCGLLYLGLYFYYYNCFNANYFNANFMGHRSSKVPWRHCSPGCSTLGKEWRIRDKTSWSILTWIYLTLKRVESHLSYYTCKTRFYLSFTSVNSHTKSHLAYRFVYSSFEVRSRYECEFIEFSLLQRKILTQLIHFASHREFSCSLFLFSEKEE